MQIIGKESNLDQKVSGGQIGIFFLLLSQKFGSTVKDHIITVERRPGT
jgi:hypothetical protein